MTDGLATCELISALHFTVYASPNELSCVVAEHGLRLHQYADDSQIYISVALRDADQ